MQSYTLHLLLCCGSCIVAYLRHPSSSPSCVILSISIHGQSIVASHSRRSDIVRQLFFVVSEASIQAMGGTHAQHAFQAICRVQQVHRTRSPTRTTTDAFVRFIRRESISQARATFAVPAAACGFDSCFRSISRIQATEG